MPIMVSHSLVGWHKYKLGTILGVDSAIRKLTDHLKLRQICLYQAGPVEVSVSKLTYIKLVLTY